VGVRTMVAMYGCTAVRRVRKVFEGGLCFSLMLSNEEYHYIYKLNTSFKDEDSHPTASISYAHPTHRRSLPSEPFIQSQPTVSQHESRPRNHTLSPTHVPHASSSQSPRRTTFPTR
jgi:hypothetical protein